MEGDVEEGNEGASATYRTMRGYDAIGLMVVEEDREVEGAKEKFLKVLRIEPRVGGKMEKPARGRPRPTKGAARGLITCARVSTRRSRRGASRVCVIQAEASHVVVPLRR